MIVFISQSGESSRYVAEGLRDWVQGVINAVQPWVSAKDLKPGVAWFSSIADELERANFGVVCLTAENVDEPWLHFEAGALSKIVGQAHVVPYLIDLQPADLTGPFAQFQAVASDENGTRQLMHTINAALETVSEKPLTKELLDQAFEL